MGRLTEILLPIAFCSKNCLLIVMLLVVNNYEMCEVYESSSYTSYTLPATKISNIRCKGVILCILYYFFSHLFPFTFSMKNPWHLAVASLIVGWLCRIVPAKPFNCCQLLILVVAHHYFFYFNMCYPFI